MKVLFDETFFYYRYGGAPKYIMMLLKYLPREYWTTTDLFNFNTYAHEELGMKLNKFRFRGEYKLVTELNKLYTKYRLSRQDYDVFQQTNFRTYGFKQLGNKPMVMTYHDSNLSTIDPHPEIVALQQKSIERANAIIAVSQNTKKDLLRLFNVDEKKVHVIYHGIEIPKSEELAVKKLFVYPYILFVGRRSKYKNFKNFVLAFARIHKLYPEIKVVCTSSTFNQEEYDLFKSNEVDGCFVNINATEHEMKLLYRDALLFIFPSYYEGFGMPILEAWSCNCPVAVSDASCFPEIAKDGALYFKPDDVDGMSAVMEKLISDDNLRLDLIARGQNRVKDFSWKKTAQKHLEIYENLI